MSLSKLFRLNRYLFAANLLVLVMFGVFFVSGLRHTDVIDTKHIVLRGDDGVVYLEMTANKEGGIMAFSDEAGAVRLQLQGGNFPAMLLRSESSEIIGTFFPLEEGGAAIGLGDREGNVATFLKGGESPSMSLYKESKDPYVSLGINHDLPHFVMFPMNGQEGMMIHGSSPTSIFFVDEEGKIPVTLSRHGLDHKTGMKNE